jgi:hypothetical protein
MNHPHSPQQKNDPDDVLRDRIIERTKKYKQQSSRRAGRARWYRLNPSGISNAAPIDGVALMVRQPQPTLQNKEE